jgi:hypothetical protein
MSLSPVDSVAAVLDVVKVNAGQEPSLSGCLSTPQENK